MPSRDRDHSARYRKLRRRVLREEPLCRAGCGRASVEVDHITPLARGGSHHRQNLQGLCRTCHSQKSVRERVSPARRAWLSYRDELRA